MKLCEGWDIELKKCFEKVLSSLTLRIFLITALILFAACGVTYLFIAWATPITYQSIASDALKEQADQLANKLQNTTLEESGPLLDSFRMDTGAEVTITDASDNIVEVSTSFVVEDTAVAGNSVTTITELDEFIATDPQVAAARRGDSPLGRLSSIVMSMAVSNSDWNIPFTFADSNETYHLMVAVSITAVNQTVETMGRVLPWLAMVILIISLLGALFYSRSITRPIVRISCISQKMADLDFSWQCEEKRGDEIGILGQNLNELSCHLSTALTDLKTANAALQEDIDHQRELERQRTAFFAAASHELKTPITVLQGQLSGMLAGVDIYQDRDKYLARCLAATGRMEKLVQEMLTISQMEKAGGVVKRELVLLTDILNAQIELVEDLSIQRRQTLHVEIMPCLTVIGDETMLGRAVMNLLTNAMNYSPPNSRISVCLESNKLGIQLSVENSNARIPEEALPHLFEAFYRVEASRSRETGGSGLGLYLVRMILDRHGATCQICNTDDGVKATVLFPT